MWKINIIHKYFQTFRKIHRFGKKFGFLFFSFALFRLKPSTISRPRIFALGSGTALEAPELLKESSMPVLRTTSILRTCAKSRPHSPNRDIGTFRFAVEYRGDNLPKRQRSQGRFRPFWTFFCYSSASRPRIDSWSSP